MKCDKSACLDPLSGQFCWQVCKTRAGHAYRGLGKKGLDKFAEGGLSVAIKPWSRKRTSRCVWRGIMLLNRKTIGTGQSRTVSFLPYLRTFQKPLVGHCGNRMLDLVNGWSDSAELSLRFEAFGRNKSMHDISSSQTVGPIMTQFLVGHSFMSFKAN